MRVLIVGKKNMLHWPEHVRDAWNEVGWTTRLFLYNDPGFGSKIVQSVLKQFHRSFPARYLSKVFQDAVERFEPDVIMFVSAFFVPKELYEVLETLPKKPVIIGWAGDGFDQSVQPIAAKFDRLYSTDTYYAQKGSEFGWKSAYLPLAFNPKWFFPPQNPDRNHEVVFIGNPCTEREELFAQLQHTVTLIGPKWKNFVHPSHRIWTKEISLKQVAEVYRSCNGVINIKQGINVVNGVNMRSFEAPACGALMLHDDVADVHLHFRAGEEVLVYHDASELDEYLLMMDSDAEACEIIRRRGREKVWEEHTYVHRVNQIITDLAY